MKEKGKLKDIYINFPKEIYVYVRHNLKGSDPKAMIFKIPKESSSHIKDVDIWATDSNDRNSQWRQG